ncbi:hypothetical protein V8E54_009094 [Elaphomyces granulatus]
MPGAKKKDGTAVPSKGSDLEKPGKTLDAKGNGDDNENGGMKELLEDIDVELGRLKEGNRLKSLIGELKTQLIGKLLTTVQLMEKKITSPEPSNNGGNRSVTPTYAAILKTNAPQAKPVPSRDLREIRVKRENLTPEEADKPVETWVREINNRFNNLGVGKILGARQLPSGDLILLADSADTKTRAEAKKEEWIGQVSTKAEVRPKKYTVLVHGVRVTDFDNLRQEAGRKTKRHIEILRTHWKRKVLRLKKTTSSLMDVGSPEGANKIISEGLLKEVELFDPQCLVTRCYNCQKYGHNAKNCRGSERCGYCAAPGHSQESCSFKDQENKQRCTNCTGQHRSGDQKCPKQEEAVNRARECRKSRLQSTSRQRKPLERQAEETPQEITRRPRGRPRQVLATASDGRLSDFFSQSTPHSSSQASTSTTEEPRDSEMEDRSSTQTWN